MERVVAFVVVGVKGFVCAWVRPGLSHVCRPFLDILRCERLEVVHALALQGELL